MQKKVLISLILVLLIIFPITFCYAENTSEAAKGAMNTAEHGIKNTAQNAGNMIKGATNAVKNGAHNLSNSIMNGVNNTGNTNSENKMGNGTNATDNNNQNNFRESSTNNNYTATRTSQESTFMGMTSTTWSWLILGIAAIAIIALVWYYSMQLNNKKRND